MNWIKNFVRPKLGNVFSKSTKEEVVDDEEVLWITCPACKNMFFQRDLDAVDRVCPTCDHHMRLNTEQRLAQLFVSGYKLFDVPEVKIDPLQFRDQKKYTDRLKDSRQKTGKKDAVSVGFGKISDIDCVVAVQDFFFMGGSLGMAAGEAIIYAAEKALKKKAPLIIVTAAGGARMQEGILSLMQMPRTTVAIQALRKKKLPYIVILTDPTTGGVTASYGMLGDIHIAEPDALICFAGPRVIQDTINEKLPEGFQRAEYLLEHGMIDMVVHRHKMVETLGRILKLLMHKKLNSDVA